MKKLEPFLKTFQFVQGFDWVMRHHFFSATFSGYIVYVMNVLLPIVK
jgi:hypothetical protein